MMHVFSRDWFLRHQRTLLTMLAIPVLGSELRAALAIRRHDAGFDRPIVAIYPHAYVVANPDGTYTMDVRTHHKYAKRLYHAYQPLWQLFHWFDLRIANQFVPAFNLGFDSLTAYPDPGNPGTTTCDGNVGRHAVDETWATLRAGAGNDNNAATAFAYGVTINASGTANQWEGQYRTITTFDTSSLGVAATISAATGSISSGLKSDDLGVTPNVDLYGATPANPASLASADYSQIGATSFTGAPISYAAWNGTDGTYIDFVLNGTGLAAINTTGVTSLGYRNANYDVANVTPTWTANKFSGLAFTYADQTGNTTDPKLVVTYSAATHKFFLIPG